MVIVLKFLLDGIATYSQVNSKIELFVRITYSYNDPRKFKTEMLHAVSLTISLYGKIDLCYDRAIEIIQGSFRAIYITIDHSSCSCIVPNMNFSHGSLPESNDNIRGFKSIN